jgi:hypothetical protein
MFLPLQGGEGVKKTVLFYFVSFRRKPESSIFGALRTDWTPVFTGVTTQIQYFHSFGGYEGDGDFREHHRLTNKRKKNAC